MNITGGSLIITYLCNKAPSPSRSVLPSQLQFALEPLPRSRRSPNLAGPRLRCIPASCVPGTDSASSYHPIVFSLAQPLNNGRQGVMQQSRYQNLCDHEIIPAVHRSGGWAQYITVTAADLNCI